MLTELFSTGIVVKHRVDFAHRLKDHPWLCSNLHGHTWRIKVKIQGKVDQITGMIVDFGELKGLVRKHLDDNYDHSTILQRWDLYIKMIQFDKKRLTVLDQPPTTEVLAARMAKEIQSILDKKYKGGLEIKSLELRETPSNIVVIENDAS